jgi:cytochrome P450 family 110
MMPRTVELSMPQRERRRNPPRSVPRGIAIVPPREVGLAATNRAAVT